MRLLLFFCLFSTVVSTSIAATPQYSPRQDIATNLAHLSGLVVADFNNDGYADIAITDSSAKNVLVYLGSKANTFSAPISTPVQTSSPTSTGLFNLVAGDFNEDGKQDLIVEANTFEPLIYLTGNGDGTFTQRSTLSGAFFVNARAIDLNHDSHLDLVITANPGFEVFLGDGHGNFQFSASSNVKPPIAPYDIVAADFNGDNLIDVLTSFPFTNSLLTGIVLNLGNGDGTFKPYTVAGDYNSSNNMLVAPWYLAAADFNGDGKQDVLIGEADADILFYGNGDGTFDLAHPDSPPTLPPIDPTHLAVPLVAAADMDGDGKIDAIIADDSSQTVDVDINNGSGNFMGHYNVPDVTLGIDRGTSRLALGDLNGDGLPDIIVANQKTQNISVFFSIRPKTTPTLTLTSSASSPFVGSSISFTAKVTGSTTFTPNGTVTLLDGTTSLGQQTLGSNGQATFSLSSLTAGQHSLTANYSGDGNFNAATSSALSQSVTDFQIALPTNSQTVTSGGSAAYSLTVTPLGGLTVRHPYLFSASVACNLRPRHCSDHWSACDYNSNRPYNSISSLTEHLFDSRCRRWTSLDCSHNPPPLASPQASSTRYRADFTRFGRLYDRLQQWVLKIDGHRHTRNTHWIDLFYYYELNHPRWTNPDSHRTGNARSPIDFVDVTDTSRRSIRRVPLMRCHRMSEDSRKARTTS